MKMTIHNKYFFNLALESALEAKHTGFFDAKLFLPLPASSFLMMAGPFFISPLPILLERTGGYASLSSVSL